MMKNHQNKEFLEEQIKLGKTSKDISKDIGVSWRLVEIYLRKFDIPHTPKEKLS